MFVIKRNRGFLYILLLSIFIIVIFMLRRNEYDSYQILDSQVEFKNMDNEYVKFDDIDDYNELVYFYRINIKGLRKKSIDDVKSVNLIYSDSFTNIMIDSNNTLEVIKNLDEAVIKGNVAINTQNLTNLDLLDYNPFVISIEILLENGKVINLPMEEKVK